MKLFRWNKGRQDTGYRVMPFVMFKRFDIHLLYYPEGTEIPFHTDPVEGYKHYRMNILLWRPKFGGKFLILGKCIFNTNRIKIFRPDEYSHKITYVLDGSRYVLSIGWLTR